MEKSIKKNSAAENYSRKYSKDKACAIEGIEGFNRKNKDKTGPLCYRLASFMTIVG